MSQRSTAKLSTSYDEPANGGIPREALCLSTETLVQYQTATPPCREQVPRRLAIYEYVPSPQFAVAPTCGPPCRRGGELGMALGRRVQQYVVNRA